MKKAKRTTNTETAPVGPQVAVDPPEKATSKREPSAKKGAPKGKKAATTGKTAGTAKKGAGHKAAQPDPPARTAPRTETKGANIIHLISRPNGASLQELMAATEWQPHSIRGFLSTAGKKRGLKIESSKNEAGTRVYRIAQ